MSYYENRIKHLEGLVATMARQQRMKAIPVEAKLVERIAEYQAENTRLKAEVEQLCKAGDKMAKTLEKDQQRYNGCPSPEAEMWWIARDGGCP